MWDLAGLELTGRYGTWFESVYELTGSPSGVALMMSAEEAPGPDWTRYLSDRFYGEGTRWLLPVPFEQVTEVHDTVVQGMIDGVGVDLLAQRCDRSWAVSSETEDIPLLHGLGLTVQFGVWSGWVPEAAVSDIARASYVPLPKAC